METEVIKTAAELVNMSLGKFGAAAALSLAAMGSALGTGAAGAAAVGAWKKCYAQGKAAPFLLAVFVGAPLSQTIYGMILMNSIVKTAGTTPSAYPVMIGAGVLGGLAMGMSAWMQGKAGAGASHALAETGEGFGNYLMALGVIETVALFVMVFIGKTLA
jgi:V/A-type H+-transporting ATPase subunit K